MNRTFAALATIALSLSTVACHPQVPQPSNVYVIYTQSTVQNGSTSQPSAPSNNGVPTAITGPGSVSLTCTPPTGCTAAGAPACTYEFARATCSSATSCPANTAGNTSFTTLNSSSPATTCAYTDATPPSPPAPATSLTAPATVAEVKPALPDDTPQLASSQKQTGLMAKFVRTALAPEKR
jgi:hypothetical protein